ncbi:MAG TPA: hypothetical protein PKG76_16090 [Acidobacteriota bacterium]|nr:hypothetical protein [Acidobacteriota bacterium]
MKKVLFLLLVWGSVSSAHAFIFHDPGAYAQRAAHLVEHMGKWNDQLGKMNTQIQRFQEYQQTFRQYYNTINSIYRRVSNLSWSNLITTGQGVYRDAQRLYDLLPGPNSYQYLEALDYLTENPLYEENADYRRYVDELVERHTTLLDNLNRLQEQLEAIRSVQNSRLDKFAVYEAANEAMSAGTGEASITEQMALLNAIALEQARQNHEIASMMRMVLEKQLKEEREYIDNVNRQGDINRNRRDNVNEIGKQVGAGAR